MMRGLILKLALAVVAVMMAIVTVQNIQMTRLKADLEHERARAIGFEEAARFYRIDAMRKAETAALDTELQQGSGADAPLSDYLRNGAGRVWP